MPKVVDVVVFVFCFVLFCFKNEVFEEETPKCHQNFSRPIVFGLLIETIVFMFSRKVLIIFRQPTKKLHFIFEDNISLLYFSCYKGTQVTTCKMPCGNVNCLLML